MKNVCKKIMAMALIIAMIVGVLPSVFAANVAGFTDVQDDAWYAKCVEYVAFQDLMTGTSPTTFEPDSGLTRAMTATVLWRMAGEPPVYNKSTFTDLKSDWYMNAVAWAQAKDIVNGTSATTFEPDAFATREQIVAMLWRYSGSPKVETDYLKDYADASRISGYARDAFNWAVSVGILSGYKNQLTPRDNATRAEFAKMIYQYAELNKPCTHEWDEGKVTKEPTCTEAGEKLLTCTKCGETKTEPIPAKGHHYGDDGKCTDCGAEKPVDPTEPTTPTEPEPTGDEYVLTNELKEGDKVIIVCAAKKTALSGEYKGFYNLGVEVAPVDGKITTDNTAIVWTVGKNGDKYTFSYNGKKIGLQESYSSMPLEAKYTDWTISDATAENTHYVYNGDRGVYMEYQESFGTWSAYKDNSKDTELFELSFYVKGGKTPEPPEPTEPTTPPEPTEPTEPPTPTDDKTFQRVTSDLTDWSGTYLIVHELDNDKAKVFSGVDAYQNYVTATVADNKIVKDETMTAPTVTIAAIDGGYSIKVGDKYMGGKSSKNTIVLDDTEQLNTISYDKTTGRVKIVSNTATLRFNTFESEGQDRFRYYKPESGTNFPLVSLYKITDGGETPHVHTWNDGVITTEPTCTEAGVKTYTCSKCGQTKTEPIPALGHDYVDGVCSRCGVAEPTLTEYVLATELKDGDEVVIVNADAKKAMSEDAVATKYRAGVDVVPENDTVKTDDSKIVWTVAVVDGGYQFKNDAGETLSATSGLSFADTANVWALEAGTVEKTFIISSTTAKGSSGDPKSIEWYANYNEFSTFYKNASNEALFAMNFYVKKTAEEPVEGTLYGYVIPDGADMLKYGHIDISIPAADVLEHYEYGDIVEVTLDGIGTFEVPVCAGYDDVKSGEMLLRTVEGKDYVILAINYGQVAVEQGLVELAPEGSATKYQVREGVTFPIKVTVAPKTLAQFKSVVIPDGADMLKFGHLDLDINADEFLKEIELGTQVTIDIEGYGKFEHIPVCASYDDVASGSMLLRAVSGKTYLIFAINYGQIAVQEGIVETAPEGSETKYQVREGVTFPINVTITEEEGKVENPLSDLKRTDVRSDYSDLTDAQFANFRNIKVGEILPDTLYRSSSPINPEIGRNTYADAAAEAAGVKTFINLADTEAEATGYPGYAESYYSKQNHIFLGLPVAFTTDTFKTGLAEGMRYIINNDGPYLVHCTEGKDRAGLTAAILECLCGATYEEVLNDYVETYRNYYSAENGTHRALTEKEITAIEGVIIANLKLAFGTEVTETTDLAATATAYLKSIGLTDEEVTALKARLCSKPATHEHTYGDPSDATYTWDDIHTTCTATTLCTDENCPDPEKGKITETCSDVTKKVIFRWNCLAEELSDVTATFKDTEHFLSTVKLEKAVTKKVTATEHSWDENDECTVCHIFAGNNSKQLALLHPASGMLLLDQTYTYADGKKTGLQGAEYEVAEDGTVNTLEKEYFKFRISCGSHYTQPYELVIARGTFYCDGENLTVKEVADIDESLRQNIFFDIETNEDGTKYISFTNVTNKDGEKVYLMWDGEAFTVAPMDENNKAAYTFKLAVGGHTHKKVNPTVTTPATCTTDGVMTYECESKVSGCTSTWQETIPATGHDVDTATGICKNCRKTVYALAEGVRAGDEVIIYHVDSGKAMSTEKFAGVGVTPVKDTVTTDAAIVWKVEKDVNGLKFVNAATGETLATDSSKALKYAETDNYWTLEWSKDFKSRIIVNTTAKGNQGDPQAIEWFKGSFTTYYWKTTSTESDFAVQFYVKDIQAAEHEHVYSDVTTRWESDYSAFYFESHCTVPGCGTGSDSKITGTGITETVKKEATCTAEGKVQYSVTYNANGTTLTATSPEVTIDALGHDYVDGTCTRCGDKETAAPTVKYEAVTSIAAGDTIVITTTFRSKMYELTGFASNVGTVTECTALTGTLLLTVEEGSEKGTYSFKTSDGKYLNCPSAKKMNTSTTKDANSSWVIEANDDGTVKIINASTASKTLDQQYIIIFNYNGGSARFAPYTAYTDKAKTTGQYAIPVIYKQVTVG